MVVVDRDFADLFPTRGQPAEAPVRLALATLLQFMEGLTDRQAADAVRTWIDWKYLLCLELTDAGFDHTVLSDTGQTVPTMRDRNLQTIAERGRMAWQKATGYKWRALVEADISRLKRIIGDGLRSRTDDRLATEVAIAVNALNRMLDLGCPEYVRLP